MTRPNPRRPIRPRVRTDLDVVLVDSELVVWDGANDRVHRLDPVGSLLWPFLDGTADVTALAADVAEVFDLDLDRAQEALEALVGQLEAARLLESSPQAETTDDTQVAGDQRYLHNPPVP